MTSPYHRVAANLREQGHSVMPCAPGTKIPGQYQGGAWRPMPKWQRYCDSAAPDFLHDQWEAWPDAGVCLAHGAVIGLDLDTDRADVAEALAGALTPPTVRRRGSKGWLGYYRPGEGLGDLPARVRWYDGSDDSAAPMIELLLHGTQSVLPPTIHPGTGKPYAWLTEDTLEDAGPEDLPVFSQADFDRLDAALTKAGLTRKAPRRANGTDYDRPAPTAHDLEKPFGRSLNDRAMEAIDDWWPALDMPKTRQRGAGAWEAVPFWRASGSGRPISERNPNLKAVPSGIVDFGADRSYTPVDLVMAARDCSFGAAADWLGQFGRAEHGIERDSSEPEPDRSPTGAKTEPEENFTPSLDRFSPTPVLPGSRSYSHIKPVALPSDAEWDAMVPKDAPPFPVQGFDAIEGLLGDLARHIDAASATWTEAGALAVTLPVLGALVGRSYATPTNLRSNVYTVALGGSGTGKTSLVSPAKRVMMEAMQGDIIGQDRIASGSGLLSMLTTGPKRVCFLDEFGHMLQQIGSAGSGIHAKQILTEFTSLYSAAGTVFKGTAYAAREASEIDCPHLCLFGMATPEQFWRAFGSSSLEDGSIARYLVFPLGQTGPKDMDDTAMIEVVRDIGNLCGTMAGRVTGNIGNPSVTTVPLDDLAVAKAAALKQKETAFADYAEKNAVRGGPAILRRVTENALKIALISAVGRSYDRPEIDGRDMDIGHALAWWSACVMVSSIASHIADNQLERDVNDVERFIMTAGGDGRSRSALQKRFRNLRKRDLQEILEALEEQDSISKEVISNPMGGRPKSIFRAV